MGDMLKILAEFKELPPKVKLLQLFRMIEMRKNFEESKEEFLSILSSLPADLVNIFLYFSKELKQHLILI